MNNLEEFESFLNGNRIQLKKDLEKKGVYFFAQFLIDIKEIYTQEQVNDFINYMSL